MIQKIGLFYTVLIINSGASLLSVMLTIFFSETLMNKVSLSGIVIGALIPFCLGSPVTYFFLKTVVQLEETRSELYEISMRDVLTGSYNRRFFLQQLQYQLGSAVRYKIPFSMIMFDVDDFKKINDTYGHSTGDQLLRLLSQTCMKESRTSDSFARMGGDEFVFIAPGLNAPQVFQFAQRVQRSAVNISVPAGKQEVHFTISIGCFTWSEEITEADSLLKQLDLAMYAAKNRGKNCVVHALDLMGGQVFPATPEPELDHSHAQSPLKSNLTF